MIMNVLASATQKNEIRLHINTHYVSEQIQNEFYHPIIIFWVTDTTTVITTYTHGQQSMHLHRVQNLQRINIMAPVKLRNIFFQSTNVHAYGHPHYQDQKFYNTWTVCDKIPPTFFPRICCYIANLKPII